MNNDEQIYKYELPYKDDLVIKMPANAKVLTAQSQDNKIVLWAMVNIMSNLPHEHRIFSVCLTGKRLYALKSDLSRTYINTIQIGDMVYHVFEIVKIERKAQPPYIKALNMLNS